MSILQGHSKSIKKEKKFFRDFLIFALFWKKNHKKQTKKFSPKNVKQFKLSIITDQFIEKYEYC